jgi:hypothetical protein
MILEQKQSRAFRPFDDGYGLVTIACYLSLIYLGSRL